MSNAIYDSDAAFRRTQRMWRKLAGLLEKHAYAMAEKGYTETALNSARIADVCFNQATGENDFLMMKDVLPKAVSNG